MKTSKILFCAMALGAGLASCDDYLDVSPVDQVDENDYWKTESHIRTFANGSYPSYFSGFGGNFGYNEKLTDNTSDVTQTTWPYLVVSGTDAGYTYSYVRRANYLLEGVEKVPDLDDAARNHWRGIGRLLRGIEYCDLSFNYGDTQWYTTRINSTQLDSLYKPRDSRDKFVMPRVLADLRFALDNIRENDGELQINRYVAAAMISQRLLREGTFLKYHGINADMARQCLEIAKDACLVVMNSGKYSLAADYASLFASEDLSGNPEVILYKRYIDTKTGHSVLNYNYLQPQTGPSRDFADAFLAADGLPVYAKDINFCPKKSDEYFAGRDPRLSLVIRPDKYYIAGEDVTGAAYSRSGFSLCKYMDRSKEGSSDLIYTGNAKNTTDCPQYRLGQILVDYAEICYELGSLSQADLDKSINVLRDRNGVKMPHLQVIGGQPAVSGQVYDDPLRDPDVPSLLWEIRRERRVELAFEGSRLDDLKRWKKLIYLWSEYNPAISTGAWISYSDFEKADKTKAVLPAGATEGYLVVTPAAQQRPAPQSRDYIRPIPTDQIQLFEQNGYVLEQNPQWK
ncbi:MAG: RagB/SusD family nutrient uptake outer membrane protein [Muribaculaceae bacterium]|nr:RagB/SusD family nutrient uptake outer membrane protein [Muribaculaceae bacterium]